MYNKTIVGSFLLLAVSVAYASNENGMIKIRNLEASKIIPLGSLKKIPVPGPTDEMLAQFVKNKKAAIQLGKALFWDTRVGSDNITACASCHFHAGVDNRVENQIGPGLLGNDNIIQKGGINYYLKKKDFPILTNDVVSSAGVFNNKFLKVDDLGIEKCKELPDDIFHAQAFHGVANTRRVEPRHAPSTINAVFNFRNFWDGRATNTFNGIDPFGLRNLTSYIWKDKNGTLTKEAISLPTSSLASQASGPPLSGFEMSCKERLFHNVAHKMIRLPILVDQDISRHDSVLGQYNYKRPSYEKLIKEAFVDELWTSKDHVYGGARIGSMDLVDPPIFPTKDVEPYSQMEANFSVFFSLAIQLYESTLVSDDSPFDRFADGQTDALTEQQKRGLVVFNGPGACVFCHSGAETTSASVSAVKAARIVRIFGGLRPHHDNGFFNIGVRPTSEDIGVGGLDPFGNPLSETMMIKNGLTNLLGDDFDPTRNPTAAQIVNVHANGAFKVPTLRNVELSGPYFHNGGKSTLRQVVEFYNRGGDFPSADTALAPLNLTEEQKTDLVAFMLALTDDRVRYEKAPFDHPSLCFPNGHKGTANIVDRTRNSISAKEQFKCIDAVGASGRNDALKPFLGLSPFAQ